MFMMLCAAAAFALQDAEFAKYHREITGREPASGLVTFAVDPKVSASGRDAYVIRSAGAGARIVGAARGLADAPGRLGRLDGASARRRLPQGRGRGLRAVARRERVGASASGARVTFVKSYEL